MPFGFPLLVNEKFGFFFLSREGERGCVFAVFLAPFPEKGILDFTAHGSTVPVFTISWMLNNPSATSFYSGLLILFQSSLT